MNDVKCWDGWKVLSISTIIIVIIIIIVLILKDNQVGGMIYGNKRNYGESF